MGDGPRLGSEAKLVFWWTGGPSPLRFRILARGWRRLFCLTVIKYLGRHSRRQVVTYKKGKVDLRRHRVKYVPTEALFSLLSHILHTLPQSGIISSTGVGGRALETSRMITPPDPPSRSMVMSCCRLEARFGERA